MQLWITEEIEKKLLEKHDVTKTEVLECFGNREGKFAPDTREEHATNPPTVWFIAKTDAERLLKIVFVYYSKKDFVIKSAFEPNQTEIDLYERYKKQNK